MATELIRAVNGGEEVSTSPAENVPAPTSSGRKIPKFTLLEIPGESLSATILAERGSY